MVKVVSLEGKCLANQGVTHTVSSSAHTCHLHRRKLCTYQLVNLIRTQVSASWVSWVFTAHGRFRRGSTGNEGDSMKVLLCLAEPAACSHILYLMGDVPSFLLQLTELLQPSLFVVLQCRRSRRGRLWNSSQSSSSFSSILESISNDSKSKGIAATTRHE